MPTGLWIPTDGCNCWRCLASRSLRTLGVAFAVGVLVLGVLFVAALFGGGQ